VAGAGYVVLMALSRTYLGAHWVTDTIGGMLVGGAVAVLVWVLFARRLRAEREART
jgi:undecaprenyl-diphosphatase